MCGTNGTCVHTWAELHSCVRRSSLYKSTPHTPSLSHTSQSVTNNVTHTHTHTDMATLSHWSCIKLSSAQRVLTLQQITSLDSLAIMAQQEKRGQGEAGGGGKHRKKRRRMSAQIIHLASWLQIFILCRPLARRWTEMEKSSRSKDAWAGHS